MSRDLYETGADRAREIATARRFSAAMFPHATPAQTNKLNGLDVAIKHGRRIVALAEIKNRFNSIDAYPTLMLSFEKVAGIEKTAALLEPRGVPVFLVVAFNCGTLAWQRAPFTRYHLEDKGRTVDTRDALDLEAVAMIPIADFDTEETAGWRASVEASRARYLARRGLA